MRGSKSEQTQSRKKKDETKPDFFLSKKGLNRGGESERAAPVRGGLEKEVRRKKGHDEKKMVTMIEAKGER